MARTPLLNIPICVLISLVNILKSSAQFVGREEDAVPVLELTLSIHCTSKLIVSLLLFFLFSNNQRLLPLY